MNDLIKIVGLAKIRADAGFSRVGRRLNAADSSERALMILTARAVSVANAISRLCLDGHANESLPLLRALAEFASTARWMVVADVEARARVALAELEKPGWAGVWDDKRSQERARSAAVPTEAADLALGSAADFVRGNAQGLPWGHVFSEGLLPGRKPEEVLAAAAQWLSSVLEALDRKWPGDFPGAAEMRDAIQISRGQ